MSIKQIKSLVQFARGTSLIFDSLTTPIPDGVVVFAIDNGAFKLGDGVTLYANLPTLFKYEDLLGAQGGISALFKPITVADNGKIVVVSLDTETSTVKYAVSNTTLPDLLASIAALEAVNTTQDTDIAGVLATALSIDVSINTGMDNNVIVISGGRYMNSGTSIASIQAQVAAQTTNQPGSHLDEPVFYTTADKKRTIDRLALCDDNTYYVDVIGYNNNVPTPVFGITCSNTNVTITNVSGSLFSVKFNGITNALKTDIPAILVLSIDNGLGTSTVKKAVVCKVQRQRIIAAVYGGTDVDSYNGVVIDSKNNIIAVGNTASEGTGTDALILKLDTNFNILAKKRYGGAAADGFSCVAIDVNDNVFAAGQSSSESNDDISIVKFDTNLNVLLRKRVYGISAEIFYGITVDSKGNVIGAGTTASEGVGSYDAIVYKFDNNLNILARKRYGGTGSDVFLGTTVDLADNIICVGYTGSEGLGSEDALIVKFDTNLNILAKKRYGGTGSDSFYDVAVDANNNIIVVGGTYSEGAGNLDSLIIKFDDNLNTLVKKRFGGTAGDKVNNLSIDSQNNIICAGYTGSEGLGSNDAITYKFDSNLNILARKRYGGTGSDAFYDVAVDANNNIIAVGGTYSEGAGVEDTLMVKFPPVIPSGTFTGSVLTGLTLADSNLTLADSNLTLADSNLTLANSTLTIADSALTLQVSNLTLEKEYLN